MLSRAPSGIFGERLPLRYYLSFGMVTSGLFTCLFGLGFYWNIHSLGYYAFIQVKTQRHRVMHFLCSLRSNLYRRWRCCTEKQILPKMLHFSFNNVLSSVSLCVYILFFGHSLVVQPFCLYFKMDCGFKPYTEVGSFVIKNLWSALAKLLHTTKSQRGKHRDQMSCLYR